MKSLFHFLSEDNSPETESVQGLDEPIFDPVHVGGVIVVSLLMMGILYWLLWSLLVCGGGIFLKIWPFLQVVFTQKTLQDFGYEGYPYELGLFESWYINLGALGLFILFLWGIEQLFKNTKVYDDQ